MKSRSRLARDVFNTFAPIHARLVYHVIDTNGWAQNGTRLSNVDFFNKQDEKTSVKVPLVYIHTYICFDSIPFPDITVMVDRA